jgi:hypothetical protein
MPAALRQAWILANWPWRFDGAPLGAAADGVLAEDDAAAEPLDDPQAASVSIATPAMTVGASTARRSCSLVGMWRSSGWWLIGVTGR